MQRGKQSNWQTGLLLALFAASFMAYVDAVFHHLERLRPPTREDFLTVGTPSYEHRDFIDRVKLELNVRKDVEVIVMPTFFFGAGGKIIETPESYIILIEREFNLKLEEVEQKALLGHELGHIIYSPPKCNSYLSCQMGADLFAATHTSPEAAISLLDKLFEYTHSKRPEAEEEHQKRVENIRKLKQGK
jgi:hypothetical protein